MHMQARRRSGRTVWPYSDGELGAPRARTDGPNHLELNKAIWCIDVCLHEVRSIRMGKGATVGASQASAGTGRLENR